MEYREEIKAAIDYIEQHLDREIRVDNVAAAAGFSKYHFQRIFKSKTGLAVYEYIQKMNTLRSCSSSVRIGFWENGFVSRLL